MEEYKEKGQIQGIISAVILLVIGVGVATLVQVFVGVLSGQTYQLSEDKISAITNTTIQGHVREAIVSGFQAQETTGSYLPIIVLGVVIFLVLTLVLGFTSIGGGMGGRGSAL